jgi:hypothetical protein
VGIIPGVRGYPRPAVRPDAILITTNNSLWNSPRVPHCGAVKELAESHWCGYASDYQVVPERRLSCRIS